MPRYSMWRGLRLRSKTGAAVPPALIDLGKKLLGRVTGRRDAGGVKTIAENIRLPDGSIITAGWDFDVPYIDIEFGGDQAGKSCRLYLESGCVDLGANTASSLGDPPEFVDEEKLIHFGDTVDCDVFGGLNGGAVFTSGSVQSQCVSDGEDFGPAYCLSPVGDELEDGYVSRADKINAQGRIRASCFTGLMRRYVQAIYGQPQARYKLVGNYLTLLIPDDEGGFVEFPLRHDWSSGTHGLIDLGGHNYRFVLVTDTQLEFRRCRFSECGEVVVDAIRSGRVGTRGDAKHDRIESFALSTAVPGDVIETVDFDPTVSGEPVAYGWHFSSDGKELSVVTIDEGVSKVHTRRLELDSNGDVQVTNHDGAAEEIKRSSAMESLGVVFAPSTDGSIESKAIVPYPNAWKDAEPVAFDAAVYGFYLPDGTFELLRLKQEAASIPTVADIDLCHPDVDTDHNYITTNISGSGAPDCVKSRRTDTYAIAVGFYTSTHSSVSVSRISHDTVDDLYGEHAIGEQVVWVDDNVISGAPETVSGAYVLSALSVTAPDRQAWPGVNVNVGDTVYSESEPDQCAYSYALNDAVPFNPATPSECPDDYSGPSCPGAGTPGSYSITVQYYDTHFAVADVLRFDTNAPAVVILHGAVEAVAFATYSLTAVETFNKHFESVLAAFHVIDETITMGQFPCTCEHDIDHSTISAGEWNWTAYTNSFSYYFDNIFTVPSVTSAADAGDVSQVVFGDESISVTAVVGNVVFDEETVDGEVLSDEILNGTAYELQTEPVCAYGPVFYAPSAEHDPALQYDANGDEVEVWDDYRYSPYYLCAGRTLQAAVSVGGASGAQRKLTTLAPVDSGNLILLTSSYPPMYAPSFVGWA